MIIDSEEEEARKRIHQVAILLNEILEIMDQCPYEDELSRVSSAMGVMQQFEPGHHAVMAGVAVERLHRLAGNPDGVIGDVKGGEEFFIELSAGLIMTPTWVNDPDRVAKIQATARALFSECSKEQLALLTAIGMMRLVEGGQGPKE